MRIAEFDELVSPKLSEIELSAGWIKHYVEKLQKAVTGLPSKPGFDTKAQADLTDAIEFTERKLFEMKKAQREFLLKKKH